jgi:hypothetical protein
VEVTVHRTTQRRRSNRPCISFGAKGHHPSLTRSQRTELQCGAEIVTFDVRMDGDDLSDRHAGGQELQETSDDVSQSLDRWLTVTERWIGSDPIKPRHGAKNTAPLPSICSSFIFRLLLIPIAPSTHRHPTTSISPSTRPSSATPSTLPTIRHTNGIRGVPRADRGRRSVDGVWDDRRPGRGDAPCFQSAG